MFFGLYPCLFRAPLALPSQYKKGLFVSNTRSNYLTVHSLFNQFILLSVYPLYVCWAIGLKNGGSGVYSLYVYSFVYSKEF